MTFPIKAVVFDWAGTMIDFGCLAPVKALIEAFAAEGVALSDAEARADMGRAKRDHLQTLLEHPGVRARWTEVKGREPGPRDVEALYARLEPLMTAAAATCADLIPGAVDIVDRLRAKGVRIGSGTGYTREMMAPILPRAAAQGYAPDVVVCAGETPSGRPSPLMMWKALIELDAWPAGDCVKVDDAPVGIAEGRAAGAFTVGLAASGNGIGLSLSDYLGLGEDERLARLSASEAALRDAGADFVVASVADIWPVLETIAARIQARSS